MHKVLNEIQVTERDSVEKEVHRLRLGLLRGR